MSSIQADGIEIPFVDHTKFFGVWIDKFLDWDYHNRTLTRKLKQKLKLLNIGKNLLNRDTKKNIVLCAILQPFKIWNFIRVELYKKERLVCLQKLQDKALSIVFGHDPNHEQLKTLRMLKLPSIIRKL